MIQLQSRRAMAVSQPSRQDGPRATLISVSLSCWTAGRRRWAGSESARALTPTHKKKSMSKSKLTILQLNELQGNVEPCRCVLLCVGLCYLPHRSESKFFVP